MSNRVIFEGKPLGETRTETFDFTSRLAAAETISTAAVTAAVYSGVDTNPAGVIYASPTISGKTVTQKFWAGTLGVTYWVTCTITTSLAQTLQLSGYLTIVPVGA